MKNIVVLGGGESGFGAAYLAKSKGYPVFVSDYGKIQDSYKAKLEENEIEFEEGQHDIDRILKADIIVKSPGISNEIALIQKAFEKGIEVISEIEWAYRHLNGGRIIGITGSNGKTTTSSLMFEVLKNFSDSVCLAGNIGISFSYRIAEKQYDYYVLELSSFQLDDIKEFKADYAVLLNLSPDHLDRYHWKMEEYVASKFRVSLNQTSNDHFIYWNEGEYFQPLLQDVKAEKYNFSSKENKTSKAYFNETSLTIDNSEEWNFDLDNISLKGKHNYMNVCVVGIIAQSLNIPQAVVAKGLAEFQSVEHRLEPVRTLNDIRFINDSKATNVDAVLYALDTFSDPIVWVAGGIDKGNDYNQIKELVKSKVKVLIVLGDNIENYKSSFEEDIEIIVVKTMDDAVNTAYQNAESGDVVLLSPACSSFDLFNNYGHRGLVFKECVHKLK